MMQQIGKRNALLAVARKFVDVPVAEAGASFRLREMSGAERDVFEAAAFVETVDLVDGEPKVRRTIQPIDFRARLVALCLVDEDGTRLFADDEVHQLAQGVPASIVQKLFAAAQTLNGLDGAAVEKAEADFVPTPTEGSDSGLPSR